MLIDSWELFFFFFSAQGARSQSLKCNFWQTRSSGNQPCACTVMCDFCQVNVTRKRLVFEQLFESDDAQSACSLAAHLAILIGRLKRRSVLRLRLSCSDCSQFLGWPKGGLQRSFAPAAAAAASAAATFVRLLSPPKKRGSNHVDKTTSLFE